MRPKAIKRVERTIYAAAIIAVAMVVICWLWGCTKAQTGTVQIHAQIHIVDEMPAECRTMSPGCQGCAYPDGRIFVLAGDPDWVCHIIGHEMCHLMHWRDPRWPDPDL